MVLFFARFQTLLWKILDISRWVWYNRYVVNRGVAQLVARVVWDHDAAGSNPVTPTMASVLTAFEML